MHSKSLACWGRLTGAAVRISVSFPKPNATISSSGSWSKLIAIALRWPNVRIHVLTGNGPRGSYLTSPRLIRYLSLAASRPR